MSAVVYPENPEFRAFGTDLQVVTRCVCGHVMEWHYVIRDGSPSFRSPSANRCPDWTCDCTLPRHDGGEPQRLPAIGGAA